MARINIFENGLVNHIVSVSSLVANSLSIQGIYMPGSLSFNNVAVVLSGSGGVSENLTLSFGLYSLNGSTLSLGNSASQSTVLTLNQTMFSWISLVTSATQDIIPGNWYLGMLGSTSLGGSWSLVMEQAASISQGTYGGPFIRGYYSASTGGLPSSIATSDMIKEGGGIASTSQYAYILIGA